MSRKFMFPPIYSFVLLLLTACFFEVPSNAADFPATNQTNTPSNPQMDIQEHDLYQGISKRIKKKLCKKKCKCKHHNEKQGDIVNVFNSEQFQRALESAAKLEGHKTIRVHPNEEGYRPSLIGRDRFVITFTSDLTIEGIDFPIFDGDNSTLLIDINHSENIKIRFLNLQNASSNNPFLTTAASMMVINSKDIHIRDCKIKNNQIDGISATNSSVHVLNCQIHDNTGGGIKISAGAANVNSQIESSHIHDNGKSGISINLGGVQSVVDIIDCDIRRNRFNQFGGGVEIFLFTHPSRHSSSFVKISDTKIVENFAPGAAGIFIANDGDNRVEIDQTEVSQNKASGSSSGGIIIDGNGRTIIKNEELVHDNTPGPQIQRVQR